VTILYLLRSSMSRYFAVPAFIVGLIQLQGNPLWVGEWNMGQQTAVNYSLVAVLAVAAGSVLDARAARATVPDLSASSRRLPGQLVHVLASAFWGYVVVVLLVLVAWGTNAAVSAWRTPNLLILLAGLAWLTLHSAVGWLLGWYLIFPVSVPLALLIGWLLGAVPAATPDAAANLLTAIDDGGFPAGAEPRSAVILAQCLLLAGLAGLAVLPTQWKQLVPPSRFVFFGVPALAVVIAVVSVSVTGPQRRIELVAATGPMSCAGGDVPACSFPDHIRRRDAAARLANEMWAPLQSAARPTPGGIIEDRLARPGNWIPINLWAADAESAALELARGTVAWQLCGPEHAQQRAMGLGANQRVTWLLSQLGGIAGTPRDATTPVAGLPIDQQIAWWYQRPTDATCV
jgi:hypothetical protein